MKHNERFLFFLDYEIINRGFGNLSNHGFPRINFNHFASKIEEYKDTLEPHRLKNSPLFLEKAKIENDTLKLLVSNLDKNAAPPIISKDDRTSKKTTQIEDDEGIEYSAHIYFDLNQNKIIYEHINGLSRNRINLYVNNLLKQLKTLEPSLFIIEHPTETDTEVKFATKFRAQPILSKELSDAIETNNLAEIELIKKDNRATPIDGGNFQKKMDSVFLKPHALSTKNNKAMAVLDFLKNSANDFDYARLKATGNTGNTMTIQVELQSGLNISDLSYIKKERIDGFTNKLTTSHEDFNDRIDRKIMSLF